jgi:hypothetical protein
MKLSIDEYERQNPNLPLLRRGMHRFGDRSTAINDTLGYVQTTQKKLEMLFLSTMTNTRAWGHDLLGVCVVSRGFSKLYKLNMRRPNYKGEDERKYDAPTRQREHGRPSETPTKFLSSTEVL